MSVAESERKRKRIKDRSVILDEEDTIDDVFFLDKNKKVVEQNKVFLTK